MAGKKIDAVGLFGHFDRHGATAEGAPNRPLGQPGSRVFRNVIAQCRGKLVVAWRAYERLQPVEWACSAWETDHASDGSCS